MSTNHDIEVEIKALLGSAANAKALVDKITDKKIGGSLFKKSKQLNHYFLSGDLAILLKNIEQHLTEEEAVKIRNIFNQSKKCTIRTRQANDDVILVMKATLDDTSSENGTARLEYEITFPNLTLQQLDEILINSGFAYQAKWSREREEYKCKDYIVCIDKNAGYGYLAEFEKVVTEPNEFEKVKGELRKEMEMLGIEELSQERLERMFAFYNKNWPEYYGTDKTFTIK